MIQRIPVKGLKKVTFLRLSLTSSSLVEVLDHLDYRIKASKKTILVTPNPEFVVFGQKNQWFIDLLNRADMAVPDGVGLVWGAGFLGQKIQRVTGADLVQKLLILAQKNHWSMGIVGARKGDQQQRALLIKRLNALYRPAKILALEETPDWSKKPFELIFACQGMGEQEKWIFEHYQKSKGLVFVGAGGSLDYLTGFARRAPLFVRLIGFEWLWRLLIQPWRFRRQLALLKYIQLVFKEKLR